MASEFEDEKKSKALRDWEKFVSDPLVTDEEVAQELVKAVNDYADELRFVQEQYHYRTGKRLDGFACPEGRLKMSDIIFTRVEHDKKNNLYINIKDDDSELATLVDFLRDGEISSRSIAAIKAFYLSQAIARDPASTPEDIRKAEHYCLSQLRGKRRIRRILHAKDFWCQERLYDLS